MKKLRATDRDRRRSAPAARRGLRPVVAAPAQRPELALPRRISGIVQCAFRGDQIAQQFDPAARADYTGRRGGRCPSWSPKRSPTTRPPSGATAASPPQTPTPAASFSNSTHAAAPSSLPSLTRTDSSSRDPRHEQRTRCSQSIRTKRPGERPPDARSGRSGVADRLASATGREFDSVDARR